MRIGVFGGTFDPVHLGHLIIAEQCREQAVLDQVRFVPSARPPHKLDKELTPFAQRVEMLALALAGQPSFLVEEIEKNRPGPSYTADTLEELSRCNPDNDWFLIIGSDTLSDLPSWHEPARIVARATILVVERPRCVIPTADTLRHNLRLPHDCDLKVQLIQSPLIEISSRDIRGRAATGRSMRYLLPRSVECYVQGKKLYQSGTSVK